MKTWDEENDYMIETVFKQLLNKASVDEKICVELFLTDECNQNCEYCYLIKHQDELYPSKYRKPENILKNLKIFLNYILKNNFNIKFYELFTGEIWHTQFGIDVLNIILKYCKQFKNPPELIMIPSNFTFILNDKILEQIEEIIKEFKKINVELCFSCSIDGYYIEQENRPFKDNSKNIIKNSIEYYDKIFKWCKKQTFGFHPMVNSYNIEKWPQQYKWWIDKLLEYNFTPLKNIMFLEVRDNNWTTEKINSYLIYLNEAYNYTFLKLFNNNYEEFLKYILNIDIPSTGNYHNLMLCNQSPRMSCMVDRMICIRVGDLSWVPCHRTCYDPFVYGTMKIKNDNIIGIQAKNLPLLFSINSLGYQGHPKCDLCPIGDLCLRGCFGSQIESNKEIFFPCQTVCDLFIAKVLFQYAKIKDYITKSACQDQKILKYTQYIYDRYITEISQEEKDKWTSIIKQLIIN